LAQRKHAIDAVAGPEKVAEWPREESLRHEIHDFGETLREEDQPSLGIGFPDPVCARLGDVAKARLARFDGSRRLPGMVKDEPGESCNEPKREQKRWQDVTDQLLPESRRLPREATQVSAVGGVERQRGVAGRLWRHNAQITQPQRIGDRVEKVVAVEELGIDDDGRGPCGVSIGWVSSGVIGLTPSIAMAPSSMR
jgi:hypothetical protein